MFRPGDHVIYDPTALWQERSGSLVRGMTGVVTRSREAILEIEFDEPVPKGAIRVFACSPYAERGFRLVPAPAVPQPEFLSLLGGASCSTQATASETKPIPT